MPFELSTVRMLLPDVLPPEQLAPEMIQVWVVHPPTEPCVRETEILVEQHAGGLSL